MLRGEDGARSALARCVEMQKAAGMPRRLSSSASLLPDWPTCAGGRNDDNGNAALISIVLEERSPLARDGEDSVFGATRLAVVAVVVALGK
jgi:hypothetical protein